MSKQPRVALDPDTLKPIIEAMIFASEEPLSARALLRLLAGDRENERAPEEVPPLAAMMAEAAQSEAAQSEAAAQTEGETNDAGEEADQPEPAVPELPEVETAAETVQEAPVETEPVREPAVETAVEEVETPLAEPEILPAADDDLIPDGAPDELPEDAIPPAEPVGTADATAGTGIAVIVGDAAAADDVPETAESGAGEEMDVEDLVEAIERAESRSSHSERREVPDALDQAYLRAMIDELNDEYDASGRAFRIVEVAGGFQFATVRDYGEFVAMLSKDKARRRLSPAALETLAILAYRQPVSKPEVEAIRGVNCDQVLLSLMEKNLIAITGRSEAVGRPLLYGTTEEFLRIFGLRGIGDLPKLREIEELMEEAAYNAEPVITVDAGTDVEEIEAKVGAAGHAHRDEDERAETAGTDDVPSDEPSAEPADEPAPPEEIPSGDDAALDAAGSPGDAEPAAAEIPATDTPADEPAEKAAAEESDAPADAVDVEEGDEVIAMATAVPESESGAGDEADASAGSETGDEDDAGGEPPAVAEPPNGAEPFNGAEDAAGEETPEAGDEVEHDIRTA